MFIFFFSRLISDISLKFSCDLLALNRYYMIQFISSEVSMSFSNFLFYFIFLNCICMRSLSGYLGCLFLFHVGSGFHVSLAYSHIPLVTRRQWIARLSCSKTYPGLFGKKIYLLQLNLCAPVDSLM